MDERHYNSKKLTVIFAISSLVLLASIFLMTKDDYDRPWKAYQKEFQALEIEKTRVKFDKEEKALEADSAYKELQEKATAAQQAFATSCPDHGSIEQKISELKAADDLAQQKYKFSKAEMDASKYRYEEARSHQGDYSQEEKEYNLINSKLEQLQLESQASQDKLTLQQKRLDECRLQLKELEKAQRQASLRRDLLMRKLSKIDPNAMPFVNRIAELVRNQPIIDLANPSIKIQQIVLSDIRDDVNFMNVPKVDRCISCHLGIDNPDFKDAVQPFKAHPNLEQFIDKDSPHPMEEFGCTSCHGGRGRATDFVRAAHTPSSAAQQKEWEEKYGWKRFDLWEDPMLPLPNVEAGCFKCHSGTSEIKGAEKLNLGLQLIERAGCYSCHTIDKYKDWPKPGPNLMKTASKVNNDWMFHWIKSPHAFRPETWMPSFYGQSNSDDPQSIERGNQEILAIVHYLTENSESYEMKAIAAKGDPFRGEELVKSVGCMACHMVHPGGHEAHGQTMGVTPNMLRQEFGPNLYGMGSKTTKEWIYNWIKDPKNYHSATRMPSLRLSDQEASDIAEYLVQLQVDDFASLKAPGIDEAILDEIVKGFLEKDTSKESAKAKAGMMTQSQKLAFAGEKLIGHYGCYSCHDIKGFENTKPIGTDLTEEGSKDVHKLDFGFVHIEHTKRAWFEQKLKDPRIFDEGKLKTPDEKLRMPNYYLNQAEVEAITTALLGFVEKNLVEEKIRKKDARQEYIEEGQEIVRQFNCQACHLIEGEGAAIRDSVKEWLIKYNDKSESEAGSMITSFAPPDLIGEGQKVQTQWLFDFLHQPSEIRPWLKVRMPSYEFNGEHLNMLVKYFNALDGSEFPFAHSVDTGMTAEQYQVAESLFSKDYFGCASCHIVGNQMPAGSPDSWAPNFALAKTRLRPGWVIKWLENPQELLPGTKMPTYFDPNNFESAGPPDVLSGDEHEQIRYLRNFLYNLKPADAPQQAAPAAQTSQP